MRTAKSVVKRKSVFVQYMRVATGVYLPNGPQNPDRSYPAALIQTDPDPTGHPDTLRTPADSFAELLEPETPLKLFVSTAG